MKRGAKLLLVICAMVVLLVAIVIGIVATFDWNRAKPWLSETVAKTMGRSVQIDGDLQVHWRRDADLDGWRSWVPTPHVRAARVVIGNTPWGRAHEFLRTDSVEFDLAVLPLLSHFVSIESMRFVGPVAAFERNAAGANNWTFTSADSPWRLDLGRIALDEGKFTYFDQKKGVDVGGQIEVLGKSIPFDELVTSEVRETRHEVLAHIGASGKKRFEERADRRAEAIARRTRAAPEYAFAWTAEGTFAREKFKGTGKLGGVFFLRDPNHPFPVQANVNIGTTRIAFVGTVIDPTDPDAIDLRLWLSGSNLSKIYDIAQIPLPNSPPYAMEGHLFGRLDPGKTKMKYEEFTARIGQSDMSGSLDYEARKPRPLLSGKVRSEELQFRDLAALVGAHVSDDDAKGRTDTPTKVLPSAPFRIERWRDMDADVEFTGDHVFRDSELPIHEVDTRIVMNDAVLALDPLKFRYAYGNVASTLKFDGRNAPVKATMKLTARGMQLNHLLPAVDGKNVTLGEASGEASLNATGNSVGELLGATNGDLRVVLESGTISKALIETASLNLPNMALIKLFGDQQVKIDCGVADLVATKGVFDARVFVIDTDIGRFDVTGKVDLGREWLDLTVRPTSKGVRLLSLHSPLYVRGPFKNPDVGVEKGALLARAAGAIGLAVVAAPAAALVPLTNLGKESNRCEALLQQAQAKKAPSRPAAKKG